MFHLSKGFIAVAVVVVCLLVGCKTQYHRNAYEAAHSQTTATQSAQSMQQQTKQKQAAMADASVRTEKYTVIEEDAAVAQTTLKRYSVVVGSFGIKSNAQGLQKSLQPAYTPTVVQNEKGMYRVLLISYNTYEEAREKLQEVRERFADAWILAQQE